MVLISILDYKEYPIIIRTSPKIFFYLAPCEIKKYWDLITKSLSHRLLTLKDIILDYF